MTEHEDSAPYVYRPANRPTAPQTPAPYPRPARVRAPEDAPEGLSWRQRRRWRHEQVKAARRDQRAEVAGAVASWRVRDDDSIRGLGIVALVVAVVIAAAVWLWPTSDDDGDSAPAAASTTTSSRPGTATPRPPAAGLPQTPPTTSAEPTSEPDEEVGHDHEGAPTAPPELTSPAGEVAHQFLLGYNTYNPAFPDPLDAWLTGWENYATDELVDVAPSVADLLYAFTVASSVAPAAERVSGCTQVTADVSSFTWECDVHRILWPIGAGEGADYTVDDTRWRVTVTDTDTPDPRVIEAVQLSITEPSPGAPAP